MTDFLSFKNVSLKFSLPDHEVCALNNINIDIKQGEVFGIVGESGSGKSQLMLTLLGLLDNNASLKGDIFWKGVNLRQISKEDLRQLRASVMSIVFQDPMTSLNPFLTIQQQLVDVLLLQQKKTKIDTLNECRKILKAVHIPDYDRILKAYPHELSGGLRQRVLIAMALLSKPELLIADEPTTALDVTIQKEILELLLELKEKYKMTLIIITHDMGVIAKLCQRVLVMNQSNIMECSEANILFSNPEHSYTKKLLAAVPRFEYFDQRIDLEKVVKKEKEIFSIERLKKYYSISSGIFVKKELLKAVDGVSFKLYEGQSLGIVGESGCGKSTLAFMLAGLIDPSAGLIKYKQKELNQLSKKECRSFQREVQIIFQDPQASLNPRLTIYESIKEPLALYEPNKNYTYYKEKVMQIIKMVGLDETMINRYPHSFSGGQCQRIGIARALISQPKVLICDEVVSALDVTVQAQILDLLAELKEKLGLTLFFISHDLSVVNMICEDVLVLNKGKEVESGKTGSVFKNPKQAYTKRLLDSVLRIN